MNGTVGHWLDMTLREFLDRTAERSPTPGGGSVAALVAALGAALGQMSARFTVGHPKHARHEPAARALVEELGRAREAFGRLIAEDIAAYERWAASRKNTAGSPSEVAAERERALAAAAAVPMELAALAAMTAERMDRARESVNPSLIPDLAAGVVLCEAAAQAAAANARANLAMLADRDEARRLGRELERVLERARQHRDAVLGYQEAIRRPPSA